METLEKTTTVNYIYTEKELNTKINQTIDKIKKWSKSMYYRFNNDIDIYTKMYFKTEHISKNQLKKINKFIIGLNNKMTLRKVNSFLHLIYKTFEPIKKVQVKKSEKELEIQRKRKEWLKLRDEAEKALSDYKKEKGNYYKNKEKVFYL